MEQNIDIFSGENLPGGRLFEFCRIQQMQKELVVVGGYLTQEVLLKPSTPMYSATFLDDTLKYACNPRNKNGDDYFEHVLNFRVFKRSGSFNHSFQTMKNERYLVFFTNHNGMREVMGDKGHGAKFEYSAVDGKSNEYKCKFTYNSRDPLPVISDGVTDNTNEVDDGSVGETFRPFG